jgi:hypothetical protein
MNASSKVISVAHFAGRATWEVVTDEGVIFACDRHHVEMSEAKMIRLERMRGKKTWNKIPAPREILYGGE